MLIENELKKQKYKILLVEDAESILLAIKDYLKPYFIVDAVENINLAFNFLTENADYDLLISDINLAEESASKLVKYCKHKYPNIKIALITSYDINDYIQFIKDEEIDQVITKHSQLSLRDIFVMAYKSITKDIFGIEKYFHDIKVYFPTELKSTIIPKNKEVFSITIKNHEDRVSWIDRICKIIKDEKNIPESLSKLVLDEITLNAMIRAPKHKDGTYKYQHIIEDQDKLIPKEDVILEPEDYFILQYGFYDDWIIIACQDPHGALTKKEILYRLHRHAHLNPETRLPHGLSDSHGRGIFLLREHMTHLIFNIQNNKKTEVLCFYNPVQVIPYKNISIYEI
ncbi:MAG: response regulator [Spirochaetia bacterium]|nr:response regulator [Spirochaetia bacterium]